MEPQSPSKSPTHQRYLFTDLTNSILLETSPQRLYPEQESLKSSLLRDESLLMTPSATSEGFNSVETLELQINEDTNSEEHARVLQKIQGLFDVFECILLQTIDSKSLDYDYQQRYEDIYELITLEKKLCLKPYQNQTKYPTYKDLILANLFDEIILKKIIPKINETLQNCLKSQHHLLPSLQFCSQILTSLLKNTQEISSLLLYVQTDIDSNSLYDLGSESDLNGHQVHSWVSEHSLKSIGKTFPWNDQPHFNIKIHITHLFVQNLLQIHQTQQTSSATQIPFNQFTSQNLQHQNIFFKPIQQSILFLLENSISQIQSFKNSNTKQKINSCSQNFTEKQKNAFKQNTLNLMHKIFELITKSSNSSQENSLKLHTFHAAQKVILDKNFTKSLLTTFKSILEFTNENIKNLKLKIQPTSQISQAYSQKANQTILQYFQIGKAALIQIKHLLRELFLGPPFELYIKKKETNKKSNQEYLKERMFIKQEINSIILAVFCSSIFTQQNLSLILELLCCKLHKNKSKNINSSEYQEIMFFSKSLFSIFLGQPHQQQVFYSLTFLQNYPLLNKVPNQEKQHLNIFAQYFSRSQYFFDQYREKVLLKIKEKFVKNFSENFDFHDLKKIRSSNELMLKFLELYEQLQKAICFQAQAQKSTDLVLKCNSMIFAHHLQDFIHVIELPQVQFPQRFVGFLYHLAEFSQSVQKQKMTIQQRRESERKVFMSLFRLASKHSNFLAEFQRQLCTLMIADNLNQMVKLQETQSFDEKVRFKSIDDVIVNQIKKIQGSEYVARIIQLNHALKSANAADFFKDFFTSPESFLMKSQIHSKTIKTRVIDMKIKPKLTYTQQMSLKTLEKLNVILMNENTFSNLMDKKYSKPWSVIYRNEKSINKNCSQAKLNCFETFKIDQMLSKFTSEYEQKFRQYRRQTSSKTQQKSISWVLWSKFESNVILNIKVPKASTLKNLSMMLGSTKHEKSQMSSSQMISTQKDNQPSGSPRITVRMPALMADMFFYGFRKGLLSEEYNFFTINEYLKSKELSGNQSKMSQFDQLQLLDVLLNYAKELILKEIFTAQAVQSEINEDTPFKINEMLIQWKPEEENQFSKLCVAKSSEKIQIEKSQIKKPVFVDLVHPEKFNSFKQKNDLESEIRQSKRNNPLNLKNLFQNPSQEVLLLIESVSIRLFKRQKRVKLQQTLKKCTKFIFEHFEKQKFQQNGMLKSLKEAFSQAASQQDSETTAKVENLVKKIIEKLHKKQFINTIPHQTEINWFDQTTEDVVFQYNP